MSMELGTFGENLAHRRPRSSYSAAHLYDGGKREAEGCPPAVISHWVTTTGATKFANFGDTRLIMEIPVHRGNVG
jgi:hypothetical protein